VKVASLPCSSSPSLAGAGVEHRSVLVALLCWGRTGASTTGSRAFMAASVRSTTESSLVVSSRSVRSDRPARRQISPSRGGPCHRISHRLCFCVTAQLLANARSALLVGWWWWEERPHERTVGETAFGTRSDLLSVLSALLVRCLIFECLFPLAGFRDREDDAAAGPEGDGDDSQEASKVRVSHLCCKRKMRFVASSFNELDFSSFCNCPIPQEEYVRSVCGASGSRGGKEPIFICHASWSCQFVW